MIPPLPVIADLPVPAALVSASRAPRCTVGLRHYRRRPAAPFTPSSMAVAGALDIYAEGRRDRDVLRMLFGLSVLRSATAAQVDAAVTARRIAGRESVSESRDLFAAEPVLVAPAIL